MNPLEITGLPIILFIFFFKKVNDSEKREKEKQGLKSLIQEKDCAKRLIYTKTVKKLRIKILIWTKTSILVPT